MEHLTTSDPIITEIGAVNTVIFDGDALIGYNTDLEASMAGLLEVVGKQGSEKTAGRPQGTGAGLRRCGTRHWFWSRTKRL